MDAAWIGTVTVLGAACGLDRTAFGQTLLAHPMIAASLAGAIAGDARAGVYAGIVLTAVSAPVLPVGERRLRDWTSAAVFLGAMAAAHGDPAVRGAALLASLAVALVGGALVHRVRARAGRVLAARRARPAAEHLDGIEREHLGLAALHAVRGAAITAVCCVVGALLLPRFVGLLASPERLVLAGLWMVAPLAGLPLLLRFHAGPGRLWPLLAAGLVIGIALGSVVLNSWPHRALALRGIGAS